jgi:hypothetical protein
MEPWDNEIDCYDAAQMLGVTINNLRQLVHKKQLTILRYQKRRSMFSRAEVEGLRHHREARLKKPLPTHHDESPSV